MDAAIFSAINGAHSPAADALMLALTRLGYGASVWFALALLALAWPRHRAAATRALLAVAVVFAVNDLVAAIANLARAHDLLLAWPSQLRQP